MTPIRLLIVEDDLELSARLAGLFLAAFAERGLRLHLEQVGSVAEARRLAKSARETPYDLVSLDVNLGDAVLSGLDVLDTFRRFHSAWMVALLTGVETDPTLDQTLGIPRAEALRRQLRRDAYARFPAERLQVVEKPTRTMPPAEADQLLADRVGQIVLLFEEVSRLRYVFRPIEVEGLLRVPQAKGGQSERQFRITRAIHWQIRYNCGEIRTLPDLSGFKTLHYLLSRNRMDAVTPEEALAVEPKAEKPAVGSAEVEDPVARYFEAQGIAWKGLSPEEQENLMRAALSLKLRRYCELRGFQEEGDLSVQEEGELQHLRLDLGALSDAAETAYQRLRPREGDGRPESAFPEETLARSGLHVTGGGNYERLDPARRGNDSPAAQLFRARMKRVRDCLRENGFADFAGHLENYVMSTGASWSYHPPAGVEWTT